MHGAERATSPDSQPLHTKAGSARLHGLDALRGGALLLGVVIHTVIVFVPGLGPYLTGETQSSPAALVVVSWIHLFRMALFVMLAGYFGRMVLHRRGPGGYLKDRVLRILLPLLAFWPIALGGTLAVGVLNIVVHGPPAGAPQGEGAPTAMPGATADAPLWTLLNNPIHLWFLNVLIQVVVIVVLARAIGVRLLGGQRLTGWAQRAGRLLATPFGVLIAAVPYAAALLQGGADAGDGVAGIADPVTFLPEPAPLVAYVGAFLVGWCLHARQDALARLTRFWPVQLGVALALTVLDQLVGDGSVPPAAHAAVVALAGWTWIYGLTGLCTRFLRTENRAVRYLADSSYWVYLLHLPVMGLLLVLLADLTWPIPVTLLITWTVGMTLLLLSYDLLVRGTWIGRRLNGRRKTPILFAPPTLPPAEQGGGGDTADRPNLRRRP